MTVDTHAAKWRVRKDHEWKTKVIEKIHSKWGGNVIPPRNMKGN